MEKEERRKRRSASAERIKNAYNGESKVEVEVIEATDAAKPNDAPKEMKVCAYCRVSTEEESVVSVQKKSRNKAAMNFRFSIIPNIYRTMKIGHYRVYMLTKEFPGRRSCIGNSSFK